MILDASALLAVVFREPGHERLVDAMMRADVVAVGTPTLTEAGIVLHARLGDASRGILERILDEFGVEEIPFGSVHWREAVDAFRRYGKGHHPAGLNFGDCLTYAAARLSGEPLLFVGDDFGQTDVERA
ncbi:MAG: type II toxin-antitoxin system VapC family toxin [Longimicrobiales bacterium]